MLFKLFEVKTNQMFLTQVQEKTLQKCSGGVGVDKPAATRLVMEDILNKILLKMGVQLLLNLICLELRTCINLHCTDSFSY